MSAAQALAFMIAGHFLCDYPLQGDWLSRAKNHRLAPVPGEAIWPLCLVGHASIHAAMVYAVTASPMLALAELLAHVLTDYAKCDGRISYNGDQAIHIACKAMWAIAFAVMPP